MDFQATTGPSSGIHSQTKPWRSSVTNHRSMQPSDARLDKWPVRVGARTIVLITRIKTAPGHLKIAPSKFSSTRGSVRFVIFKAVQALPLRERRTWCPRMSRGGHADSPRNISFSWTWHRPVHGLDSAGNRTWTGTFHVREQSATAFSPRQQSCPRTIHVHRLATASIVRERAAAVVVNCPQTVRIRELSTSANYSRTQSVHDRGLAKICPRQSIAVSSFATIHFPIHVQIIPAYAFI